MPLFRRSKPDLAFTVGVDDHRVIVGGGAAGCELLDDLDGYVSMVAQRTSTRPDGRDGIAVLNAKMDFAELVDAAVTVLALALEELVAQGVVAESEIPERPRRLRLQKDLPMYDYIQVTYDRALQRMAWMTIVDSLLRQRGVAVLRPVSVERR